MLQFKVYERTENSLISEGTVLSAIGTKGSISLIPKNFKDATKRVAIVLKNAKGASLIVSCSEQVSKGLRDKSITVNQLAGFEILSNEDGVPFISMPTGALIEFKASELKVKEYTPAAVDYSELVTFS